MYIYIHIHIFINIYSYMYIYIHISYHIYIYIYIYIYMCVYMMEREKEGERKREGRGEWTSHAFWPCFTQWDSMLCHHDSCLGFGFAAQLPAECCFPTRCRANSAQTRQSKPDYGLYSSYFSDKRTEDILICSFQDADALDEPLILARLHSLRLHALPLQFGFRDSLYMYMYTHVYTYVYIYVYTYLYTYICIYICINIYIHVYRYRYLYDGKREGGREKEGERGEWMSRAFWPGFIL